MFEAALLAIGVLGIVVIAASGVIVAYVQYRRHVVSEPAYLKRERLRAYSEIMDAAITVNRLAVELMEEDRFQVEFERYTMEKESEFTEPVEDVTAALHRHYHVVDPYVKDAVNDYLNFLSRYPRDEVHVGELLSRTSQIVITMRTDLGLPELFPNVEEDSESESDMSSADTDSTATIHR